MADYVKGLEVATELLLVKDGHHEEQAVVVPAVHSCRYRVHVKLLPQREGIALEGDFIGINLCPEAAVAGEALHCIGKAAGDEIAVGRVDFEFLHVRDDA